MYSEDDIRLVARILRLLPKGRLPLDIFYALSEKVVLPTLEMMVFRKNSENGNIELLLTKRPSDDPYWPNGWHLPGTVLLSTDISGSYDSAFSRIFDGELENRLTLLSTPQHVTTRFWDSGRGREVDQLFVVEAEMTSTLPDDGMFYSLNNLPQGTLGHYGDIFDEGIFKQFSTDLV